MLSSNPNNKNSFHRRNDSGELDVFEAARYFSSSGNDQNPGHNNLNRQHKYNFPRSGTARMSLDLPMKHNAIDNQPGILLLDQKATTMTKEKTKYKQQPSSPGGRLANFINSLFNQAHLRKNKSKSKSKPKSCGPTKLADFEERKRRSSMSHFSTTTHNQDYSGFRTPPPYADTPTKSYKEFRNLSGFRNAALPAENIISRNGSNLGFDHDRRLIKDHHDRDLRKLISDDDDGADSDSSSDLFDLPNHELDFYGTDLPVYETTHVDRINNIAKPISRATTV